MDRFVFIIDEPALTGCRKPVECVATDMEMLLFRVEFATRYGRAPDIRKAKQTDR